MGSRHIAFKMVPAAVIHSVGWPVISDELAIMVLVELDEPCSFGFGGDQQVGDLHAL